MPTVLFLLSMPLFPLSWHSFTWNRFWNGKGKNVPLDLHLEHNNFWKSFLKDLDPNMTEQAADRISKSIGVRTKLMDTIDTELEASKSKGIHHAACQSRFSTAELFKTQPAKEFTAFPGFNRTNCLKSEVQ
jgi:hypothetical protein